MKRSPNVPKHPKGWRFAGAAYGHSFWQNGPLTYRITSLDDPMTVLATETAVGLCMARARSLQALQRLEKAPQ